MNEKINSAVLSNNQDLATLIAEYLTFSKIDAGILTHNDFAKTAKPLDSLSFLVAEVENCKDCAETLAKLLTNANVNVPFLFVGAPGTKSGILKVFKSGVDIFLPKPFTLTQLDNAIENLKERALMAASGSIQSLSPIQIGNITFDPTLRTLHTPKGIVKLTSKESALLNYMATWKNTTLTRQQILGDVWAGVKDENSRTLDVYMTKLRKYFVDEKMVSLDNVHGVGFILRVK